MIKKIKENYKKIEDFTIESTSKKLKYFFNN